MSVVVVGGSLAGLTAGLLLRDLGLHVRVYERSAAQLESRGAGIVVHPIAVRYLEERGGLSLSQISTHAHRLLYIDREGAIAYEEPCVWSFTAWNTLYRNLRGLLEDERYLLGDAMTGLAQDEGGVDVSFQSGRSVRCELLVCADGVASTGRSLLLPEVHEEYAGYVAWRGTVPEAELPAATQATVSEAIVYHVMPDSHILTYPIPALDGSVEPGRRLINFVWYRNARAGAELDELKADRHAMRDQPAGAPLPEAHAVARLREAARLLPGPLAETVLRTEEPFVQPINDVVVPRMAFGRACLVGDAAFVARPHAAAGTAKAAADGWTLAEALEAARGDVPAALARWEPGQLKLGRGLVARVRDAGDRSQFGGGWRPGDPSQRFGLYGPDR